MHATPNDGEKAMPVKIEVVNRWEARLDGDASVPSLSVNSIDSDDKSVKVRLGTTERILTVEDWMGLVTAVQDKIKYSATR
jgi:hypothetical protein